MSAVFASATVPDVGIGLALPLCISEAEGDLLITPLRATLDTLFVLKG